MRGVRLTDADAEQCSRYGIQSRCRAMRENGDIEPAQGNAENLRYTAGMAKFGERPYKETYRSCEALQHSAFEAVGRSVQ